MPASLRELIRGRPGKGKEGFPQAKETDFFKRDFPQPLPCTTGWSLSSKLRRRTSGQDGGLGICLSSWQEASTARPKEKSDPSIVPSSQAYPLALSKQGQVLLRLLSNLSSVFANSLAKISLSFASFA